MEKTYIVTIRRVDSSYKETEDKKHHSKIDINEGIYILSLVLVCIAYILIFSLSVFGSGPVADMVALYMSVFSLVSSLVFSSNKFIGKFYIKKISPFYCLIGVLVVSLLLMTPLSRLCKAFLFVQTHGSDFFSLCSIVIFFYFRILDQIKADNLHRKH